MPPKIFDRKEKMNILKIPHRNLDLLRLKIVILLPIYTFPPLYAERPAERRVFLHLKNAYNYNHGQNRADIKEKGESVANAY